MSTPRSILVLTIAALVLLLAACGDDTTAPPPNSGIEGLVTIGPMCPVVQEGTPCPDQPYEATIVVEDADGDEVARTQSGEDGLYRVDGAPGRVHPGGGPVRQRDPVGASGCSPWATRWSPLQFTGGCYA